MAEGNTRAGRGGPGPFDNLLLVVLWSQVLLLGITGVVVGETLSTVAIATVSLLAAASTAMLVRRASVSALAVSIGLVGCAVVFVEFTGGAVVSHVYFLLVIAAVGLYRDWRPLVAATGLTILYHLTLSLFSDQFEFLTAAVFSGFAVGLALVIALSWRPSRSTSLERGTIDRLRLTFEAAPIGMAVLKPSGEFIEANRALADLLGGSPGDYPGTNIRRFVHSDDMDEVGKAWEQIGNNSEHSASLWVRCMTSQGTSIWSRMSLSLVPRSADQPAMVVVQVEDMTRTHAEQRRLEILVAGKDRFVAMVGEEIREPLDLVIDLTRGPEFREIQHQARAAASIVDDLVASAKAGTRTDQIVSLPIDPNALCHDVVSLVADSERVRVEVTTRSLWADPGITRQIVYSLLSNAIRYGGPHVTLTASRSGPDTIIEVGDDGTAIPESDRERIFNSDLRFGRPATRPAAVGLSLSVGRHLARLMDGDVTYRRTADGQNVYELRLPSEELGAGYASERSGLDIPA